MTEQTTDFAATQQPPSEHPAPAVAPRSTGSLWAAATASALLGTTTIWMAMPGVNWTLWTVAVSLAFLAHVRRAGKPLDASTVVPVALACLVSSGAAITADEAWQALTFMVVATLLACATLLASGQRASRVGALWIVFAPPVAAIQVLIEALRRAGDAAGILRAERSGPVVRGLVIAAPVVGLFALLLSGADPTLAGWRDAFFDLLESLDWIPRLVFFLVLGGVSLGAFGLALRPAVGETRTVERAPALRLGVTERTVLFASVAALFAVFLVLQLSYLFGNAPAVAGSGLTFAEYARRGFGELTVVATLCTLLILASDRFAERGRREEHVRVLQLLLVAELQLLLASAFRRVLLYESAYGFTSARLYAQAYMVLVSMLLVMLAWEIWSHIDVRRLTRRGALLGVGMFAGLTLWNHDAWIAAQNIERYESTGKLDVWYLSRGLSPNALPTVVRLLPRLPASDAAAVRQCIHARYATGDMWATPPRWYEWNLRRAAARRALAEAGLDVTTPATADAGYACHPLGVPRPVAPAVPAVPATAVTPQAAPIVAPAPADDSVRGQ